MFSHFFSIVSVLATMSKKNEQLPLQNSETSFFKLVIYNVVRMRISHFIGEQGTKNIYSSLFSLSLFEEFFP